MFQLPKYLRLRYEASSAGLLQLGGSIALVVVAYVVLTHLPWFLLPLGWALTGATLVMLMTVAYACRNNNFFGNTFVNHIVGQLCLVPLLLPFENWHKSLMKGQESITLKITDYLSGSHFWWCTSLWNFVTTNVEAFPQLFEGKQRKRLMANLFLLYVFCGLFFPLMTYNLGLWGLAKYYIIPLMVYHVCASSFFKTDVVSEQFEQLKQGAETVVSEAKEQFVNLKHGAESVVSEAKEQFEQFKQGAGSVVTEAKEQFEQFKQGAGTVVTEAKEQFEHLKQGAGSVVSEAKVAVKEVKEARVEWITTIWLLSTPLMALFGLLYCEYYWQTFVVCFIHYITGGIGITGGYHRLFSHRAYKAHPIVKNALVFVSTGCFQMSVFEWCIDHRAHHRYTDTDKDPYSINKGFFYAHLGWLLWKREVPVVSDISDLEKDPVLQFQHKYYPYLAILQGLVLPTVICGYFWGDYLGGFLIAGVLSRVVVQHATFAVNSVAHYFGSFTYSDQRSPRDSWWVGLVTFGEGYHNFHHEFPYDYRNGYQWKNFDPTKWLIWSLSLVGLTHDLMFFDKDTISKGKIQMQEKALALERNALHWGPPASTLPSYTMDQVKEMCKSGEKLMVCEGFVHDVRHFIEVHPAGAKIMRPYMGKDITKQFNGGVYNHSNAARNMLHTLRIAKFVAVDSCCQESAPTSTTAAVVVVGGKEHSD
eukprot:TRINITY_DN364_c0_g1_i1.p1 TRINITY_DN364_c0_g1~~TRINITY_DN364_c0_g1_i1.p1  ORF type:complete len:702 (+),score=115.94 TRINITY_DN364_c0_g1_i1:233-2338(+)